MLNLFIIFIIVAVFFLSGIFVLILSAPKGVENERGFHYDVKKN